MAVRIDGKALAVTVKARLADGAYQQKKKKK